MKTLSHCIIAAALLLSVAGAGAQSKLTATANHAGRHSAASADSTVIQNVPAGLHMKFELDSTVYDEIGVYFSSQWSDNYDNNDAYDLDGFDPKVYLSSFTADNVRVSINAWSSFTPTPARIRLYVRAVQNGTYTLSLEDFINIDTSKFSINLVDNQQHDSVDMAKYSVYTFSLLTADTAAYDNRFVLAVEAKTPAKPLPPYQLVNFSGQKVTTGVELSWEALNAGSSVGFTVQKLNEANGYDSLYTIQSDSATKYSYTDQHPVIGNNVYRLKQNGLAGQITYSAPITIGYGTATPAASLSVYPNPSSSTINIALNTGSTASQAYVADIYNMSGSLVMHQSVSSGTFTQDISNYKYGVYFIQLKDTNGYLVGQTKFMKSN